jgi:hypothetical protein
VCYCVGVLILLHARVGLLPLNRHRSRPRNRCLFRCHRFGTETNTGSESRGCQQQRRVICLHQICVLILLYMSALDMCPHTTIYVLYYIRVLIVRQQRRVCSAAAGLSHAPACAQHAADAACMHKACSGCSGTSLTRCPHADALGSRACSGFCR